MSPPFLVSQPQGRYPLRLSTRFYTSRSSGASVLCHKFLKPSPRKALSLFQFRLNYSLRRLVPRTIISEIRKFEHKHSVKLINRFALAVEGGGL
jgi:hypothetical protein